MRQALWKMESWTRRLCKACQKDLIEVLGSLLSWQQGLTHVVIHDKVR